MLSIMWKGMSSLSITGLMICELPPITKPKMKTLITKIDGRDGDIIEDLGYESYVKTIKIGLTKNYDINQVISFFSGSGTLTMSNELDKVYNCKIIERIDYEKLLRFKTALIKFYTQPYKYKLNEPFISTDVSGLSSITVRNQGNVPSKPIIELTGSGTVTLKVNGTTILTYTFPSGETHVVIDSEQEEAYLNGVYKNRNMTGEFPVLRTGNNTIAWTGTLGRIEVHPQSRWL